MAELKTLNRLGGHQAALTINVTRGDMVESRHSAIAAMVDSDGQVLAHWGDLQTPVYPRSAVKPFQAIPLVQSGALDHFGLDERHLALASASHNGEAVHTDLVKEWLDRLQLTTGDLECGPSEPIDPTTLRSFIQTGGKADQDYNNCSGKHCGFLSVAKQTQVPTRGYIGYDHPVQQAVRVAMGAMFDCSLDKTSWGIDGCGIPTYAMPIVDLAYGFARFADPRVLPDALAPAAKRVCDAMMANPYLVGGHNRFDTEAMLRHPGKIMVKSGAEGVCAVSLPGHGIGIVTKVVDGGRRASDVAMGHILRQIGFLNDDDWQALQSFCEPLVRNVVGLTVGQISAAASCGNPSCNETH